MAKAPIVVPRFAEPRVDVERREDGTLILRSPEVLADYPPQLGVHLRHWAEHAPERVFLAERQGETPGWRSVTYAGARTQIDGLSQALLDLGLDAARPLMILSGNSVNHGLLTLAAMQVGIPVAPVSPAYSLMSQDFAKVRAIEELVCPGSVFVEDRTPFTGVLAAIARADLTVLTAADVPSLAQTAPSTAVEDRFGNVGPDSVAKYLFTSGSTGQPKGVINTQRMLCANQQQYRQVWPFLLEEPPVMVDWLPWNHTFGGNVDFGQAMTLGGTLYIDAGKPVPALVHETVRNLREISPTMYANVPAGYSALLPHLEQDEDLRNNFFRRLKLIFYAGADLPQDLWDRLEAVSVEATGRRVAMVSAWGSTETAPMAVVVHWPIERAGVIGLPAPGVDLKLLPSGDKMELRVRGPNVMPGYLNRPDLTADAFDEEGFYLIGDAGRLADPDDPLKGIAFDGRVAEDFKLISGTWVHVGALRIKLLAALAPALQDLVVAGQDKEDVAVLAWLNVAGCAGLAGKAEAGADELITDPAVRAHITDALAAYNKANPGSSTRIARLLLMADPPDIDGNEITDKGYINQRAVLAGRADRVARLYAETASDQVIVV
jgi:feruloyl-CoA synthase